MNTMFALVLASLLLFQQQEQQAPKARQGTYAITNARIETVTNGTIENGTIVIEADRIVAVGTDVDVPVDAEVIDGSGLEIYPGMIDSGTRLGLTEIGAVSETNDSRELGDITPQMEALTAINPNSVLIPVARVAGITTVISEPTGGMLPGTAAMINLVGYTPDQMHAGGVKMLVLDFPNKQQRFFFRRGPERDQEERYSKEMDKLNEVWDRAELYHRIASEYEADPSGKQQPEYVPEMDAIRPALSGERPLMVKVDAAQDIEAAIDWVQERKLENVVFSGVSEGWRVADRLAEAGIPVIAGPVLATPSRSSDRYDRAYANAGLMTKAGVKVALRSGESENVRNLPFNAGFAATYGMGREEALRSVTQTPAEIFGISDEYGSIEVGKKANLFVSDGDPFETSTNVLAVFIDGFNIPMTNRQIELYEEFLNRDEGRLQPVEIIPTDN